MAKFKIQSAPAGTEDDSNEWETIMQSNTPQTLLNLLINEINGDRVDTENNMLRLISE